MEFQIIKTDSKENAPTYSWRIVTLIGEVLAHSHHHYSSYDDCTADVAFVSINAFSARTHDLTGDPATLPPLKKEQEVVANFTAA